MRSFVAALICTALCAGAAMAQTASQITPQSFRPPLENASGGVNVPQSQGLATPAGAEALFVTLEGVTVEDGFDALADATKALEDRLTGRRISGADIFAAARDLEAAYAAAGYVLARVILPPQTLLNGARLKLVVIDGFFEKIETAGVPEGVRERIGAVLAPLERRRGLTLSEIERRVLLAGDTVGVILHSAIAPGAEQGAAILVIDGKHQPVSGLTTLDNNLSTALGRWTLGLGLDLNSVLGFGELAYVRATGNPNLGVNGFLNSDPRNRAIAAGFVVPIGVDGMTFNIEGTEARTNPIPTAGVLRADRFQRLSARLRYPFIRSRNLNFTTEISFDAADDTQSLVLANVDLPLALDRVRVLRLSAEGNWSSPWGGAFSGRITTSFGLDGLGARSAADAGPLLPLSRQYADASFEKLDFSLFYAHLLVDHLAVNLFARGQTSFGQPLVLSEQFGAATSTGLSSFDAGTLQGDSGASLRGELTSPWALPLPLPIENFTAIASPYIFGAAGFVALQQPTALELSRRRAASYGLGLRLNGFEQGGFTSAALSLEWGRQAESGPSIFYVQRGDRFMLSALLRL